MLSVGQIVTKLSRAEAFREYEWSSDISATNVRTRVDPFYRPKKRPISLLIYRRNLGIIITFTRWQNNSAINSYNFVSEMYSVQPPKVYKPMYFDLRSGSACLLTNLWSALSVLRTVVLEIALTNTHWETLSWPHRQDLSADHLLSGPHQTKGLSKFEKREEKLLSEGIQYHFTLLCVVYFFPSSL